ncbi:GNAT family N-acetyltransferase [Lysinibacillus sp. KCTC 33748]|uniref:GNAT family N-acetyltransferase n=1 Tax=unclassified Lysinibacillus TaxID=2636778 RepID=UPI0009A6C4CC|nr:MULTISPECIES: GNAT family N-acetyltransferase [unclassified Lysinibacillus]OXS75499.1 GNAT family N-acetyltransferase [Lysinibacillus sp. KCTC 33748]SKB54273.1 ribosomal-protein-alanine N-acetyltransferase [Lysinibacillus sp. AC-3]
MIEQMNTKRLYLRKMQMADAHSLFNIWSDPEVTKFMNITNFAHEEQAKEMIELFDQLAEEHKAIRLTIIEKESNEIIGSCGFNSFDEESATAEIGYDIAKAYWGKGYAPECISALMDYAFTTLNITKIEAKIEPGNSNSIKVVEKLNFTFEGTFQEYEESKESFYDINVYSFRK